MVIIGMDCPVIPQDQHNLHCLYMGALHLSSLQDQDIWVHGWADSFCPCSSTKHTHLLQTWWIPMLNFIADLYFKNRFYYLFLFVVDHIQDKTMKVNFPWSFPKPMRKDFQYLTEYFRLWLTDISSRHSLIWVCRHHRTQHCHRPGALQHQAAPPEFQRGMYIYPGRKILKCGKNKFHVYFMSK